MTETYVYFIWYLIAKDSLDERHKFIGIFADRTSAEDAVQELRTKPGFSEAPEAFEIESVLVGRIGWPEGFEYDMD